MERIKNQGVVCEMKAIIKFKDNYEITLNGVSEIQGGNQFICFRFKNEQIHKGEMVIEISKVDTIRFE